MTTTETTMEREHLCVCGHLKDEHGQEQQFVVSDSKRELCFLCTGYEYPGYPQGLAWHRYKELQL